MPRTDHYDDPTAPPANNLVPAASAVVVDGDGAILLHRRSDNELWALPGGTMEIGESILQTVVREVREETGLEVNPHSVVGIYTDPRHVIAFDDGEVRQQFSVCFACDRVSGELKISDESTELRFIPRESLGDLPMHPSIRLRIEHFLLHAPEPFVT
jgi:ADP-ribose pyrophosphatase YjhB (NUDIX family)